MDETLKKALLFEFKGLKEDALNLYKDILKKNPDSREVNWAINRIAGNRKKFFKVNTPKRDFFIHCRSENLPKFEKWLIET